MKRMGFGSLSRSFLLIVDEGFSEQDHRALYNKFTSSTTLTQGCVIVLHEQYLSLSRYSANMVNTVIERQEAGNDRTYKSRERDLHLNQ